MVRTKPQILLLGILVADLVFAKYAHPDALRVLKTQPDSTWREAATMEVTVIGTGFARDYAVRFLVTGTEELGGIIVNRVRLVTTEALVATVVIDPEVAPGEFDIEVLDAHGAKARAKNAFAVKPYSWTRRFGCTGVESWRRRIPCRRGAND
jgi:hypothetical protein